MVACGVEHAKPGAIAQPEHAHFWTGEALLDDDRRPCVAKASLVEARGERTFSIARRVADDHSLAQREPIGFDHACTAELRDEGAQSASVTGAAGRPSRCRDPGFVHEPFGERLRRLDACRGGRRAEDGDAAAQAGIGDTCRGGGIGTDDDEVRMLLDCERGHRSCVGHLDTHVLGDGGGTAVARSTDDIDAVILRARPGQRMFPAAATDDEHPRHADHSHSMVEGGLLEMSYTTRLTAGTSLTMRRLMTPRTSYGTLAQSAVIPSSLSTMRTATTFA